MFFSRRKGTGDLAADMRLRVEPRDAVVGIPTGVFTQVVLVPLLYVPIFWIFGHLDLSQDAKDLTNKANGARSGAARPAGRGRRPDRRGALLPWASRWARWSARAARRGPCWISALLFGAGHFEPLQTAALVLFGLVAGYLVQRYGRLGPSIFAHVGFNAVTIAVLARAAVRGIDSNGDCSQPIGGMKACQDTHDRRPRADPS